MIRLVLGASLLLLAFLSGLSAQAPPRVGPEFQVNSQTAGAQRNGVVALDGGSRMIVVFQSEDGDGNGVLARRYDSAGLPQGQEFPVNTFTTSSQTRSRIAADASGRFLVVWHSSGQDGDSLGVFGQRLDGGGGTVGSEFQINTFTTGAQESPAVALDASGRALVVWSDEAQDGSGSGIIGRRYDAAGDPDGGEFPVNGATAGTQSSPVVASNGSGRSVVVWMDENDGSDSGISGQIYDAAGDPVGGQLPINAHTTGSQGSPSVSMDESGAFVVTWVTAPSGSGSEDIVARRFTNAGVPMEPEFQVNGSAAGHQYRPAVATDHDGGFVVAWTGPGDGSGYGVFARRFDSAGAAIGEEFQVNTYTTGDQKIPGVAMDTRGDFVVVWHSPQDGSSDGVVGQRFAPHLSQADDFESGDLSSWPVTVTGGGDLAADPAAAMGSSSTGLRALVNDTQSLYVQADTSGAGDRFRAGFFFDPNGFDPGETLGRRRVRILLTFAQPSTRLVAVVLRRLNGAYGLMARVRRDDGTRANTGFFPITDEPHYVEFEMRRASAPDLADGEFFLWIDGEPTSHLVGIDNDLSTVDFLRLGALSVKMGAVGTLYWDEFTSRLPPE
jgi:hypothetical protein